ncbi:MAG TPA: lipid II flippase MurJ [Pyrinomonadaceae bacterium]|jgi:peptidoglycan biosynthesis protein MviN/MurJ (putative lipid II flippase)
MEADERFGAYVRLRRAVLRESRRAPSLSFRQGLKVAALASCNAALAVLSAWYIVARTGLNVETDAFFASGALPQLAFLLLSAALPPVLVPLLATRDPEGLREDAWVFFLLTTSLFGLVGAGLYATCGVWVPLLVPGFSAGGKSLTVALTKIQIVSMVLNAGIVTLWAAQQARRRFVWVELSGVLANLAGLLFLVCALPRFGIRAAAWNTVFYNCLKLALLLPVLGRWRRPAWPSPTLKEAWRLFKPLLPGQAYLRAEPLLDRFLASTQGAGSLSLLYVAQQIYANVILVTSKAMVAPLAPRLAVAADLGAWRSYRRAYRKRLLLIALLSALGVSSMLAFGPQALRLAVGHAGVTAENVYALWLVMLALAGAFAGGVSGQVASGAFYAMGDTKTPTKVSAFIYTLYLPLKIAVFLGYGLLGLAVTMSAYFLLNFLAQLVLLEGAVSRRLSEPARPPS